MTVVKWTVGILSCAFALAGASLFMLADPYYLSAPADASLIDRLQRNKPSFVLLHQMMLDDELFYVSPTKLGKPVSESRRKEYVRLLAAVGNPILYSDGKTTKYSYAGGGLSAIGSGWQKGIRFGCERDVPSLANLDNASELNAGDLNQRTIDDDWCLIFEKFE